MVALPVIADKLLGDKSVLKFVPVQVSDTGESQTIRMDLPLYVVTVGPACPFIRKTVFEESGAF
jgi:hypothetical protein